MESEAQSNYAAMPRAGHPMLNDKPNLRMLASLHGISEDKLALHGGIVLDLFERTIQANNDLRSQIANNEWRLNALESFVNQFRNNMTALPAVQTPGYFSAGSTSAPYYTGKTY